MAGVCAAGCSGTLDRGTGHYPAESGLLRPFADWDVFRAVGDLSVAAGAVRRRCAGDRLRRSDHGLVPVCGHAARPGPRITRLATARSVQAPDWGWCGRPPAA